jgi:hypothetical protein
MPCRSATSFGFNFGQEALSTAHFIVIPYALILSLLARL